MYTKTVIASVAALPLTIVGSILKYVYQDWEFVKWIVVAVLIDTFVSMVKHWILCDFNSEEFWQKLAKKVFVYIALLILSNLLTYSTVNGHTVEATSLFGEYICWAMLLREAISIIENSNAIFPWCPIWLLKRLKDYNEKGEYIKNRENAMQHDQEQNMED